MTKRKPKSQHLKRGRKAKHEYAVGKDGKRTTNASRQKAYRDRIKKKREQELATLRKLANAKTVKTVGIDPKVQKAVKNVITKSAGGTKAIRISKSDYEILKNI